MLGLLCIWETLKCSASNKLFDNIYRLYSYFRPTWQPTNLDLFIPFSLTSHHSLHPVYKLAYSSCRRRLRWKPRINSWFYGEFHTVLGFAVAVAAISFHIDKDLSPNMKHIFLLISICLFVGCASDVIRARKGRTDFLCKSKVKPLSTIDEMRL